MHIKNNILAALAYFDIFAYPLKKREIWLFMPATPEGKPGSCDHKEFDVVLEQLIKDMIVYRLGEFYSLTNSFALVQRRIAGNEKARQLMITAQKVGAVLSRFPYVRGVAVSGSLSKNFATENADIDIFIIAASGRLWICRTFMHLFKKITYLFGKQHLFCMNYYVDEKVLEIPEKNIFTATEITTLIPLCGSRAFKEFFQSNSWTKSYLPNNYMRVAIAKDNSVGFSRIAEKLFNNKAGNLIDNLLMRITRRRWEKKTAKKKLNNNGVVMSMIAEKHVSKPDPEFFQTQFINNYRKRTLEVSKKPAGTIREINLNHNI